MSKIINMTPHNINIQKGEQHCVLPSKGIVRVATRTEVSGFLTDEETGAIITVFKTEYGEVEGLPPYEEGVYYVVSGLVKAACPDRKDLLVPGKQIRNEAGQVIGCEGLSK